MSPDVQPQVLLPPPEATPLNWAPIKMQVNLGQELWRQYMLNAGKIVSTLWPGRPWVIVNPRITKKMRCFKPRSMAGKW
jgi:hypothetical protein